MKENLKTNTIVMKKFNAVCDEKTWSGFDFNKDWNVFLSRLNKNPLRQGSCSSGRIITIMSRSTKYLFALRPANTD